MDLKVSYYIHFADHLLKAKGEEVFRRVVQEGVDAYINNWKRRGKGVRAEETGRKAGGAEGEDEAA